MDKTSPATRQIANRSIKEVTQGPKVQIYANFDGSKQTLRFGWAYMVIFLLYVRIS